jgi:Mg-chelatase subunit ChlD
MILRQSTAGGQVQRRAWRSLLVTGIAVLTVFYAMSTAALASPVQVTLPDVERALNVDAVPVDYVVVVDTSGSMQSSGLYPQVQRALGSFLKGLKPTDHLSLLTFDNATSLRYTGAVGSNPLAALNQLPPTATGQKTDIGSGVEAGLAELERPDANAVGAIVLMTDGLVDTAAGSLYASATTPAWGALRARAAKIATRHQIASYALALQPTTDAALLKKVIPSTLVVAIPSNQVGPYLSRVVAELTRQKTIQALRPELANMVTATWSGDLSHLDLSRGSAVAQVSIRSSYKSVPVTISGLTATPAGDVGATVKGLPATIDLKPGQTRTFPVQLKFPTVGGFALGERSVTRAGSIVLSGVVSSPWQQVITSDLGLPFTPKLAPSPTTLTGHGNMGWSWAMLSSVPLGLLLLVLLLLFVRRSRLPRLVGTLELWHDGQLAREFPVGGKIQRLGQGPRSVPGQPLSGSVRGLRRRDEYDGSITTGVVVQAKSGAAHSRGRLFDGDSLDVGDIRITYNS